MKVKRGLVLAIAVGMAAVAGNVSAGVLQFDVNAITAQAYAGPNGSGGTSAFGGQWTGVPGQGHTGSIVLATGTNSALADLLINGISQSITPTWSLGSFSGTINLVDGVVTGGGFSLSATDGSSTDTYSAVILGGSGIVTGVGGTPPNQTAPFSISGLTFAGTFSSNSFAGVDVSQWFAYSGALPGNFFNFDYTPQSNGLDDSVDIDIFVAIPLPSAGLMGLAGLGLLGVRRRR